MLVSGAVGVLEWSSSRPSAVDDSRGRSMSRECCDVNLRGHGNDLTSCGASPQRLALMQLLVVPAFGHYYVTFIREPYCA